MLSVGAKPAALICLGAGLAAATYYAGTRYAEAFPTTGREQDEERARRSGTGEVRRGLETDAGTSYSEDIVIEARTSVADAEDEEVTADTRARVLERLCTIGPGDLGGLVDTLEMSLRSFGHGEVHTARVLLVSDRAPTELLFRQEGADTSGARRQGRRSICSIETLDSSTPNGAACGTGPSVPTMGNARASLVMRGGLQAEAVITPATAFTKAVAGERTSGQWVTCTFGRSLGAAVTFNTVKRAGKFLRRDPGYEPLVDGIPRFARPPSHMDGFQAFCYDVLAVPFSLPDGTVAGAFVVAGLNTHDAEQSIFSQRFVDKVKWLGAVAASPLVNGVRYTSCRVALDMVLRPQMAGKNTMEAEIDEGGNDEDTKKYLLTTFTASALAAALNQQHRRRDSHRAPSKQVSLASTSEGVAPEEEEEEAPPPPALDAPGKEAIEELDRKLASLKSAMDRWDLDPYELEVAQLGDMFKAMLHSLGLVRRFSIPVAALNNFWQKVVESYNDVPFHNVRHAWSVSHRAWLFLERSDLRADILTDLEVLALMFGAICHDLGHPGQNNAFQVNSLNSLALLYNDMSVLENHHCSVAFSIVTKEECAILRNLTKEEFKAFRMLVVNAILATDMTNHKKIVNKVQALSAGGRGGIDRNSPDDRQLLVSFLLHCADLSNPLSDFDSSRKVSDRVSTEFNNQAELERKKGLPVTVMEATDGAAKAKMEIGFIDFVVLPLYEMLVAIAPSLGSTLELIYQNRASWEETFASESVALAMDGMR